MQYTKATLEVILFENEDIIATSAPLDPNLPEDEADPDTYD